MRRSLFIVIISVLIWAIPVFSAGFSSVGNKAATIFKPVYAPPFIGIRINEGKQFTNSTMVSVEIKSLRLRDSLISEMKISILEDLSDVEWMPYTTEKHYITLPEGDGEKKIYARLRDAAGNTSPIESASVFLDTQPPENIELSINKGEKYVRDEQRRVIVFILTEESDLSEMMFSNGSDFTNTEWEPYQNTKRWILDEGSGDGEKTVYAKFRDKAGNESLTFWSSIILDTEPPKNGSVLINNGDKYTIQRDIRLRISAEGADQVRLMSQDNSQIIPYKPKEAENFLELDWKLDSTEGIKVVRAFFMDEAKNRTTEPIQDEIIFDATPPVPPYISINGDSKYTNHPEGIVSIQLVSRENSANYTLLISNKNDFSDTEPMSFRDQFRQWQLLAEEDGMKSVYVKLIDEAGNESESSVGKIILDRVPPVVNKVFINEGAEWTNTLKVNIHMDTEGSSHFQVNNNQQLIVRMAAWEEYQPIKTEWMLLPGDGEKEVFLRFRDAAGNVTDVFTASIKLDTQPPKGNLTIDDGAKFTNHPERLVVLKINSEDSHGMQITNVPEFNEVKLEPFSEIVPNWELPEPDGPKNVYLRLKDQAGNYSEVITSGIILDREPPTEISMVIHEGSEWLRVQTRRASLQLNAKGASHMMISENPNFPNETWTPFKNVGSWVFSEGEGLKEIYVKFRDPAGNISEVISGQIKLDYTPPVCEKFEIDGGAEFTNNPQKKVKLSYSAKDAIKLANSNEPISDPQAPTTLWEDYESEKDWVLEGEDGLKTVYAIFRDEAGNFSGRYTARIILDRIPPTNGSIIVNNNVKYVQPGGNKISLVFNAEGASEMIVDESPGFENAKWEPYVPKKVFEVSNGEGVKTIYVKYRDQAKNETELYSGAVILDTTPPGPKSLVINNNETHTNNPEKTVMLKIEAEDAVAMRIGMAGNEDGQILQGKWEPYAHEKSITLAGGDGEKEIFVHFSDEAGNVSDSLTARIILDRTPPKPVSLVIDDGSGWTNNPDKKVSLTINAEQADYMMVSMDSDFKDVEWEPYKEKIEEFTLPGEDGEKIIYVKFKDETGNVSAPLSSKVNLKRAF